MERLLFSLRIADKIQNCTDNKIDGNRIGYK
jgi:hypothetical protein